MHGSHVKVSHDSTHVWVTVGGVKVWQVGWVVLPFARWRASFVAKRWATTWVPAPAGGAV